MQFASGINRRVVVWFIAGVITAGFLQFAQVEALGGRFDALLSVGDISPARAIIESDLGPVTTTPGIGHDGQSAFIVARDPLGQGKGPEFLDHAGFRYRRVLYPAIAGMFGALAPEATLVGLATVAVFGFGLAVGASAEIALRLGVSDRIAVAALLCPGLWLSVRLLTVDALAVGLALTALALWMRGSVIVGALCLAAAVLAKDQMLLVALGVGGFELWNRHFRAAAWAGGPALVALTAWSAIVSLTVGDGFAVRGNLTLPLTGIARATPAWSSAARSDVLLVAVTLLAVALAGLGAWCLRDRLIGWVLAPWVVLAIISSHWVWELGNNAARVFAFVFPLAAVAIFALVAARREDGLASVGS